MSAENQLPLLNHSETESSPAVLEPLNNNLSEEDRQVRQREAAAPDTSEESNSDELNFVYLLTDDDFSETAFRDIFVNNAEIKKLRATRMSHNIRKRLRSFGDSAFAKEIITLANKVCKENPCTQMLPLPPLVQCFPSTSRLGLFATRRIRRGEFVIAPCPVLLTTFEECRRTELGLLLPNIIVYNGLHRDFGYYEVVAPPPSLRKPRNSKSFLQRRKQRRVKLVTKPADKPSTKYYSDDEDSSPRVFYDKYDMCIDVSISTNEIRAIRRNCRPNCIIRYVMLDQRMEVFITANKPIKAGEELTLPHDFDSNFSTKVMQCAHPYEPGDLCMHEV
ncbi:unnamed protein product [Caenorhabditis sp. 36 PRJEB53466]|nr:unnamed protein product [Caenorhabditis sp. 36 PRJEB53466]